MAGVMSFFAKYLILFIIGTVILLFALIGYFIENGFRGKKILKSVVVEKPSVEIDEIEKIKNNIASSGNQSLNQIVQNNSEVLDLGGTSNNVVNETLTSVNSSQSLNMGIDVNSSKSLNMGTGIESLNSGTSNEITFGQPVEVNNNVNNEFQIK